MTKDILQTIFGGFIASIVWFIVGGILYMNPYVAKLHKKFGKSPAVKQWSNERHFLILMHLLILVECLLFAFVYSFIKPVFPGAVIANGLILGIILIAVNLIPNIAGRWILSAYPNSLLLVDLISGVIGSFIIGLTLAFVI